jgi:hypothetical protein
VKPYCSSCRKWVHLPSQALQRKRTGSEPAPDRLQTSPGLAPDAEQCRYCSCSFLFLNYETRRPAPRAIGMPALEQTPSRCSSGRCRLHNVAVVVLDIHVIRRQAVDLKPDSYYSTSFSPGNEDIFRFVDLCRDECGATVVRVVHSH